MRLTWLRSLSALGLGLLLTGCDGSSPKVTAADAKAFEGAPVEIKQAWIKGLGAQKTNDYLAAGTAFASLLRQNLSPDQVQAVRNAMGALNERMYAASAKGDASAQQAIQTLQGGSGRR